MSKKQLECRIVTTHGHRHDLKTEVGMYDPISGRYEPLGAHGPRVRDVDKMVAGLAARIEAEGHLLTFSDVRGPR
jgi:hypothetical protein